MSLPSIHTHTIDGYVTADETSVLEKLAEFLKTLPDEDIIEVSPVGSVRGGQLWMEITVQYSVQEKCRKQRQKRPR